MRSTHPIARALCLTGAVILIGTAVALLAVSVAPDLGAARALAAPFPNAPQVDTTIWLQAPEGDIPVDTEFTVTVKLSDVADLYAIDLVLSYPPGKVQVVDADPLRAGIQSTPGDCPAAVMPQGLIILNQADNGSGHLSYAVTQLSPTPPFSGSCDVLHIHFLALDGPTAGLVFDSVTLADMEGAEIQVTAVDHELAIKVGYTVYLPMVVK
jgi:hypothetical protein